MLSLVARLPSGSKTLAVTVTNFPKADIKAFWSFPILLDIFILFQIFSPALQI